MQKNRRINKKLYLLLVSLLMIMLLCSCGQTMTKEGEQYSVTVKGLGTKKITVTVKGTVPEGSTLKASSSEYNEIEETEDGEYLNIMKPFLIEQKSKVKNGKAVYKYTADRIGDCTLTISDSVYGVYSNFSTKLDIYSNENNELSCTGIWLREHRSLEVADIDGDSGVVIKSNDGGSINLLFLNCNPGSYVEGYDTEIFNLGTSDNYMQVGENCFDVSLTPLKAGDCSITVVDITQGKRIIAGIRVTEDNLNADIRKGFIVRIEDAELQLIEGVGLQLLDETEGIVE